MSSSGDTRSTMQHISNKKVTKFPDVNYKNPATLGEIQDRLRNKSTDYNENNPEPPSMKA